MIVLLSLAAAGPAFVDQGFVLRSPTEGAFTAGMGAPTVEYDVSTGTYAMYFEAPNPETPAECVTSYNLGRATSPDGVTWTVDPEPVLSADVTVSGSPFHCVVSQPAVVHDGATWHLFFSMAGEPAADGEPNQGNGIGYATSTDGVDFTVQEAPLVRAEGVSMGLGSAAIVDGVLYYLYVWKPDFRLAWKPLDGSADWNIGDTTVIDHDDVGAWAVQWVLGPSLFCEDDQASPFSLVYAGDDNSNVRSLAFAQSADALSWTQDAGNPLSAGDVDYGALNHWDVLEAGSGYLMWYSKTEEKTGLKAIGYATAGDLGPTGPRMCPHPSPDTGPTDSGTTDSGDTGPGGDTAGLEGDKGGGGCGCATGGPGAPAGALAVGLVALVGRRRRSAAPG